MDELEQAVLCSYNPNTNGKNRFQKGSVLQIRKNLIETIPLAKVIVQYLRILFLIHNSTYSFLIFIYRSTQNKSNRILQFCERRSYWLGLLCR
jgi:hypothetical protein